MRHAPNKLARSGLVAALAACLASGAAGAADLESQLAARWKGAWVIVRPAIASDCGGFYTDNVVRGARVESRGDHRLPGGELARVEKIVVRWGGRIDVFLDLAEQLLVAHSDGPFTLYDPRSCKVQLELEGAGKRGLAEAEAALAGPLELHASAAEAEASPAWNHRQREPFPDDYERTLAAHAAWKATQTNVAVDKRMDEAIAEAARLTERVRDEPDYLAGFAAGVERARDHSFGDCGGLIDASFYPDTVRGKSDAYDAGYADGQRLAFDVGLLARLRGCYVAVPPAAGATP
jgi:hypothetical protein